MIAREFGAHRNLVRTRPSLRSSARVRDTGTGAFRDVGDGGRDALGKKKPRRRRQQQSRQQRGRKKKDKKEARLELFMKGARVSLSQSLFGCGRGRGVVWARRGSITLSVGEMTFDYTNTSLYTTTTLLRPQFVRGHGTAAIHPGAKLRLLGLLMQAQKGDCPTETKGSDGEDSVGRSGAGSNSAEKLQSLKAKAWLAAKGKQREKAMEEYLELLQSLAPNWKVA